MNGGIITILYYNFTLGCFFQITIVPKLKRKGLFYQEKC